MKGYLKRWLQNSYIFCTVDPFLHGYSGNNVDTVSEKLFQDFAQMHYLKLLLRISTLFLVLLPFSWKNYKRKFLSLPYSNPTITPPIMGVVTKWTWFVIIAWNKLAFRSLCGNFIAEWCRVFKLMKCFCAIFRWKQAQRTGAWLELSWNYSLVYHLNTINVGRRKKHLYKIVYGLRARTRVFSLFRWWKSPLLRSSSQYHVAARLQPKLIAFLIEILCVPNEIPPKFIFECSPVPIRLIR